MTTQFKTYITVLCFFALILPLVANENLNHSYVSQYQNLKNKGIKSLSDEDIIALARGEGWGLARSAELNGVPGPLHLLELKDELPLSPNQVEKIEAIHKQMQANAMHLGERYIELESNLDKLFKNKTADDEKLKEALSKIYEVLMTLRYVHLSAHLQTLEHLSSQQILRYSFLRGYSEDPCTIIPEGHNEELWLKHNHCK